VIKTFEILTWSKEGARAGRFVFPSKERTTPCYFMTCDFGGGASDLYRIITYINLFEQSNIPTLFNYYYLTVGGTFKTEKWTSQLENCGDMVDFIKFIRKCFFDEGFVRENLQFRETNWNPIIMLDSGSGNFLRDEIEKARREEEVVAAFEKMIPDYIKFAFKHDFNIEIAMDFARKYTYRKGETRDEIYRRLSAHFSKDKESNMCLVRSTLENVKKLGRNKETMIYVPLRGETPDQFREYLRMILKLEEKIGEKFDGFAIAGLADYRTKSNEIWEIPSDAKRRVKAGLIIGKAAKAIRQELLKIRDQRPIHGLGIGDVFNIIPLVAAGVDSFDCHSPWRRATDGAKESIDFVFDRNAKGISFSKYLIPAVDSKGDVIKDNKKDVLRYVQLHKVSDDVVCDCYVCRKYSLKEIKKFYSNGGEDYLFARILLYAHAVFQHDYMCKSVFRMIKDGEALKQLIEEFSDNELKRDLLKVYSHIFQETSGKKITNFFASA